MFYSVKEKKIPACYCSNKGKTASKTYGIFGWSLVKSSDKQFPVTPRDGSNAIQTEAWTSSARRRYVLGGPRCLCFNWRFEHCIDRVHGSLPISLHKTAAEMHHLTKEKHLAFELAKHVHWIKINVYLNTATFTH